LSYYLIEFRFSGYAKEAIKELKENISRNYHVTQRRIVPHITLVGPIYTLDEKRLLEEIKNICKNYELVKFYLDGFGKFENRVIYVRIKPSDELKQLRLELATKLAKFCNLSEHDYETNFKFHATLVLNDIQRKFDRIWNFLQSWKIPEMEQYVIRITIIKNYKILAEHDLLQRKTLDRSKSLDRKTYHKTIEKLDKKREPSEIKFEEVTNKKRIFVLSDTHFDHERVIRFSHRPFGTTRHMNQELVTNWNKTVNSDPVYFLGDLTFGRGRRPIDYWLGKLSGQIYHLRGNHDTDMIERATVIPDRYGIQYHDYKFLLMHKPHRPFGYDGWIIHGDKHNTNLKDYPFIHQKNKTVNVSSELVNYTPLNLDRLILLIETGRSYKTLNG
jgi:calcineurin-like phosphoesterase family protein/2'-5' RNA ligase